MTEPTGEVKIYMRLKLEGFTKEELKSILANIKSTEGGRKDRLILVDIGTAPELKREEATALLKELMPGLKVRDQRPVYAS